MSDENSGSRPNGVRIHIDQKPYHSANPTTGQALYALAGVTGESKLFREVTGDKEDPEIPNGPESVHLTPDEHFHSGPAASMHITIIVNARKKVVETPELTFAEVVALAFDTAPVGGNILFTVTYRNGPPANPEGSLIEGGRVKLKNEMIFNVRATDKS